MLGIHVLCNEDFKGRKEAKGSTDIHFGDWYNDKNNGSNIMHAWWRKREGTCTELKS